MRYRVERSRADHGYGTGWVVLDDLGTLIALTMTHGDAMIAAVQCARSVPVS